MKKIGFLPWLSSKWTICDQILLSIYRFAIEISILAIVMVKNQRQHLSAVKNRKLCGAALAQKGELCGRVRRKLSNYAAKLRRIFTKSAVIVRHFQLIFGSN